MGNEQSSRDKEERKLSQAEVNRILTKQRQEFEKKCQEYINKAQSQGNNAPSPPPGNAVGTTSFERQRAPYSYVTSELQNIAGGSTSKANLYPTLDSDRTMSGTSVSSPTVHTFDFTSYVPKPAQDFLFVNSNGNIERPRPSAPPQSSGRQAPRSCSDSRSRNQSANDELNCPTCKTMFGLQIYQCSSGHSSCKTCKEYSRPCGICRNTITNMRNITLESYMAESKVPCPNSNNGCILTIKMADLEFHVKECPFNELQCPLGCFWKGKLNQLSVHFDALHPEHRSADVDTEIQLQNISYNSQNLYLVLIGAYNFLFHVKVSQPDRKIYMTAQLIGTKICAAKWLYEIHVYNKNECRRKYTFSDVCGSFQEPVADIFAEGRCSVLPQAYASTFVNNDILNFKFYIKKSFDGKPRGNFKNQRGGKRQ